MPETESVTASAEIRDRLEFAARTDVRWKAARDVVNDARRLDRVHGSCVQAITDGFESQVGHGEYAAVFLLEVVRRLNPAVADAAARDLAEVWEDGQVGHERLGEWHAAVSAGEPIRLYIDVPETVSDPERRLDRVTDLFEKWAAEESEHRAAGEYGIAEGFRVAIEELRYAVHGTNEPSGDAYRPIRPRPATKVEIVADPETELGVLLAQQDRKGGAR